MDSDVEIYDGVWLSKQSRGKDYIKCRTNMTIKFV